jgi:hypothetical protein
VRHERPVRDEGLGAALWELEVPEHRPGFFAELDERLAAERVTGLDDRRRGVASERGRRAVRVAAVVALAAGVAAAVGVPRLGDDTGPRLGVERATAAKVVKAKVREGLAEVRTLEGRLVLRAAEPGSTRRRVTKARFAVTARGDFYAESRTELVAYDAKRNTERYHARGNPVASTLTGNAPGPPDHLTSGPGELDFNRRLGSVVRALLAAGDARVENATYEGRPAWKLEISVPENLIAGADSADRLAVDVDKQTGVPVRVVALNRGRLLSELRLEDLEVNSAIPSQTFRPEFPAGVEVYRTDLGFRTMSLEEAAAEAGYRPLVPSAVPDGFRLTEVAFAREGGATGAEGANPPSRDVISLSYRRGLDQFVVSTREVGSDPSAWSDPLATGEGFVDEPERVTIENGALQGGTAEILIVPRGVPHAWTIADDLVVTVAGDLARDQIVALLNALEATPTSGS